MPISQPDAPYLSRFDVDVFISYSRLDNQISWVDQFHQRLEIRLCELLGFKIRVWRDPRIGGTDDFSREISQQLKNAAVLVPVLSPSFRNSTWCQKELFEFQAAALKSGSLYVDNKIRIAKAIKMPWEEGRRPQVIPESTGVEFYELTDDVQGFRDFSPEQTEFQAKINELAATIRPILRMLRTRETIYLAETATELTTLRSRILRELEARRYRVLSNPPLPEDEVGLTIHLFGSSYDHSAAFQYDKARRKALRRLAWIVRRAQPSDAEQKEFQQTLQDELDLSGQKTLELKEGGTIEEFKIVLSEQLERRRVIAFLGSDTPINIYPVFHRIDYSQPNAVLLRKHLCEANRFNIGEPVEGMQSPPLLAKDHKERLMLCDAVLLYWGEASPLWVKRKREELRKFRGLRGSRMFVSRALYITNPPTGPKHTFDAPELTVIRHYEEFTANSLRPFLDQLLEDPGELSS